MGAITLRKEKVVVEDLELGTSTITQSRGDVTQINGSHIPYDGSNSINDELDTKDTIASVDSKIATREPLGGDASTTFKAKDGVNLDDVSTIAQMSAIDNAKYDKGEVDNLLADKADNSNTMLLDGTTPDPDYSLATRQVPANKGYVLDTVQNIGAGDMTKAVYDSNDNGRVDTADGIGVTSDSMGVTPYTQFMRLSQGTVLDANSISHFGIFVGVDITNGPTSGLVGIEQMDMVQAISVLGLQATGGKAQRAFSFSTFKWYTRIYDAGSDTWTQWLLGADEIDIANLEATKVSKDGDTMTGNLSVKKATGYSVIAVHESDDSSGNGTFVWKRADGSQSAELFLGRAATSADEELIFKKQDETGATLNEFILLNDRVKVTNNAPSDNDDLVNVAYLNSSITDKVSSELETGVGNVITNMYSLTQAQYDALATKNPTTFYVIVG